MKKVNTNFPAFVQLLELMRADNGAIFLDTIEAELAKLDTYDLETVAGGDRDDALLVTRRCESRDARKTLESILSAAFDGAA
jgi:hypothetical protein